MSQSALDKILREVRLVREKVERLEELVELRLVGSGEPLEDEVAAINEFLGAKEKGNLEWVPIEELEREK